MAVTLLRVPKTYCKTSWRARRPCSQQDVASLARRANRSHGTVCLRLPAIPHAPGALEAPRRASPYWNIKLAPRLFLRFRFASPSSCLCSSVTVWRISSRLPGGCDGGPAHQSPLVSEQSPRADRASARQVVCAPANASATGERRQLQCVWRTHLHSPRPQASPRRDPDEGTRPGIRGGARWGAGMEARGSGVDMGVGTERGSGAGSVRFERRGGAWWREGQQ